MMCPILSRRTTTCSVKCSKKECAWWDDTYEDGRCCIVTIAKNLNYVADVCDGTRTLFTREV